MLERALASGGMARVLLATLRGAAGFREALAHEQLTPALSEVGL
ncbi:MAG TPA: hypothetical protein VEX18_07335 [Polyangiaceae bacterium]|nr:hypothetical protein [Polyangiaceae bacterium]